MNKCKVIDGVDWSLEVELNCFLRQGWVIKHCWTRNDRQFVLIYKECKD
jgi:hypothetical protein